MRARERLKGREKNDAKKSKERGEEPLGTMFCRNSSKRSRPIWLVIKARELLCFSAKSFFYYFYCSKSVQKQALDSSPCQSSLLYTYLTVLKYKKNCHHNSLVTCAIIKGKHDIENKNILTSNAAFKS